MNKSDSIIEIAPALLEAQKKIGAAKKGSINPFFHSTYPSLGDVMEACKDILNEHGITVLQPVGSDELGVYVETVLLHITGEYISDRMRISAKTLNDPQAQGSAITYARRYSLQSMVFIPAEDDDAEKATEHESRNTAQKPTQTTSAGEHTCSIHNKPMKQRTTQNGGYYYDHRWQDDTGEWQKCNGKPKQSEEDYIVD